MGIRSFIAAPAVVAVVLLSGAAQALTIGWWTNNGGVASGPPTWVDVDGAIAAAGHSGTELADLGAASIASVDVLWVFNTHNAVHVSDLVDATADPGRDALSPSGSPSPRCRAG